MTSIVELMVSLHSIIATSLLITLTRPYRKALIKILIKLGLIIANDKPMKRNVITVRRNLTPVVPINSISKVG